MFAFRNHEQGFLREDRVLRYQAQTRFANPFPGVSLLALLLGECYSIQNYPKP